MKTIANTSLLTFGIFVTINGDIYIDNGWMYGRVDKWTPNGTSYITAMYVNDVCVSLFVDINDNLYCCLGNLHKVIKKAFNDSANFSTIIAGNGTDVSTPYTLSYPRGIFVDIKFNLYVADLVNDRIQLFPPGNLSGTTLAGNGAPQTIALNWPTGVVLDADGYLFIVEFLNFRIVGSGPTGFRCLFGCYGGGPASNQLNGPWSLSFDSYGNMFVADRSNYRIQKFILMTSLCGKCNKNKIV